MNRDDLNPSEVANPDNKEEEEVESVQNRIRAWGENRSRAWSENNQSRAWSENNVFDVVDEEVADSDKDNDEVADSDKDKDEEEEVLDPVKDWVKLIHKNRKRRIKSPELSQEILDRLEESKRKNIYVGPTLEDLVREAMTKGRRHIYTADPDDDDDQLKQQLEETMQHYVRTSAFAWAKERFSILEEREYEKDVAASGGFDVGFYPFMGRSGFCGQIVRHYCPPVFNLREEGVANLYRLANIAIQSYNSSMGTQYYLTNVIKAMIQAAQGLWYFMTFEASVQDGLGNQFPLTTFEARLFEWIPLGAGKIDIYFVRPKMGAGTGPSGFTQVPQYACCSTTIPNSFPGQ